MSIKVPQKSYFSQSNHLLSVDEEQKFCAKLSRIYFLILNQYQDKHDQYSFHLLDTSTFFSAILASNFSKQAGSGKTSSSMIHK